MSHPKYPFNIHYPPSDCLDMRPAQVALRTRNGCDAHNPCRSNECTACKIASSNSSLTHLQDFSDLGDGTGCITCVTFSIWPKPFTETKLDSTIVAIGGFVYEILEKVGVADRRWFLNYNLIEEEGDEVSVQVHTDPIPQNQWHDLQKDLMGAGKEHCIHLYGNGITNYFFAEAVNGDKNSGSNMNLHATL